MKETRIYLDTSILVKRYVNEDGTDITDSYFQLAHQGETVFCISEINLGEAAVVFDKYARKFGLDAMNRFQAMSRELNVLERSNSVEIFPVTSQIIRKAIKVVFEQHVYIVDAIQLETCIEAKGDKFFTADVELNTIAKKLGIETVL